MSLPLRIVAVLALVLGAAGTARGQDDATATSRAHFQKGEKLFALGRFDEALVHYEKAFDAKPMPAFLFNIGQCHRNLGNYDQAIFSFRKYLRLAPDAENRDAVETLIEELEAEKRRAADAARRRDASRLSAAPDDRKPGRGGKPIYARWWFWGGIAAAAGASTGAYFLLRDDGVPTTDLGNVAFD